MEVSFFIFFIFKFFGLGTDYGRLEVVGWGGICVVFVGMVGFVVLEC